VSLPALSTNLFRQIEFVKLFGKRILVILVSENELCGTGSLKERRSAEDLVRMANYLNELCKG
jgi:heat-inducible transcriptional repressor